VSLLACDSATASERGTATRRAPETGVRDERFSNGVTVRVADTLLATPLSAPLTCNVPLQFFNANPGSVAFSSLTLSTTSGTSSATHTWSQAQVQAVWPGLPSAGGWTSRALTAGSPNRNAAFRATVRVRWHSGLIPGDIDSVTVTTNCKA
jgi:hypothetical protein